MKKAIIYIRVSSKEQLEGSSLEIQEKICRDYAEKNGYEVDKVFIEKGESAKTTDRTELQLLLEYIAKNHKNLNSIIVAKIDRLARNALDHALLKVGFLKYGIKLISATEHLEDTPVGRLMENQLAGFSQFDNEIRTERSVSGMLAAVKAGRYVWKAPLGYLNRGKKGDANIEPDIEIEDLVRKIWVLLDTGCSPEEARKNITTEGLVGRNGKPISKSQFHCMIRNPIYKGIITQFNLNIVGNFKAIVEPDLFNRVQDKLNNKAKRTPIYRKDNKDFPIRGTIICSSCGHPLTASWSKGNGGKYALYRCLHCPRKNFNRDDDKKGNEGLDTKFIRLLKTLSYKPVLKEALIKAIEANLEYRNEVNKKRRKEIENDIAKLKVEAKQIAEKNIRNVISDNLTKEILCENEQTISEKELQLHEYTDTKEEVMRVVKHSIGILEDLSSAWLRVNLDIKKRFQKLIFPEGLPFDGKEFGTAKLAYCIAKKDELTSQKFDLVPPVGFEPAILWLKTRCPRPLDDGGVLMIF